MTGDGNDAVGGVPPPADVLLGSQGDVAAPLAVPGLVDDEHIRGWGRRVRASPPEGEPVLVPCGSISGRIVEEVVESLTLGAGDERGQDGQNLVVLAGHQQADQILTKRLTSRPSAEEVVELGREPVDRLGGGSRRLALGRHGSPRTTPEPQRQPTPPPPARFVPQPDQPVLKRKLSNPAENPPVDRLPTGGFSDGLLEHEDVTTTRLGLRPFAPPARRRAGAPPPAR